MCATAFRSIELDRRKALWEVAALTDHAKGLFSGFAADNSNEREIKLPVMKLSQHVIEDYRTIGLSLKSHPLSFVRVTLQLLNVTPNNGLSDKTNGSIVRVAGLVLVRQRPGTASGICFITIEDESGSANLVVFENLFQKYRKEIVHCNLLMVEGKLQKEGEVVHVVARKCYDLTGLLAPLASEEKSTGINESISAIKIKSNDGHSVHQDVFYEGRNFR